MVRRSHKRRKRFACGHLGYGRWCHRCARSRPRPKPTTVLLSRPAASRSRRSARQQAAKRRWQARFLADPIPLHHLPKPIVLKTRTILAALEQGTSPATLHGKRFHFDRTLLRIPVSYRYRLLCRWQSGRIIPLMVLSHEAYNAFARNKKRVNGV